MRYLQAKDHAGPPEAGRASKQPSLETSEGVGPANILISDFWLLDCEMINLRCLGYSILGPLLQHPYKTNEPSMRTLKLFIV